MIYLADANAFLHPLLIMIDIPFILILTVSFQIIENGFEISYDIANFLIRFVQIRASKDSILFETRVWVFSGPTVTSPSLDSSLNFYTSN